MANDPWICPKCGRSLNIRNQEHTCGLYNLESHFERRDPLGRIAFEWICSVLDNLGPYDILPMKTTIAFAHNSNVAFLTTKRKGVEISFVLPRALSSPRISGEVIYSRSKTIYRVKTIEESELDAELDGWLREAYGATGSTHG